MATNLRSTAGNFGCLMLFALPFAAGGIWMGVWQAREFVAYLRMQSWVETPAKIVRAKLECHSSSDGGDTYEATAEYTYEYGGRRYACRRVSPFSGSDNISSFHQNAHRRLQEHQKSGRPLPCYVNPAKPDEAVLFRNLRGEMIGFQSMFVVLFGGVGFGMLTFGALGYRKARADAAVAAQHPEQPWFCKAEWAAGRIPSAAGRSALIFSAIAVYWNLASAPTWYVFCKEAIGEGKRPSWFVLGMCGVGATWIVAATVSLLRRRKYGRSMFQMAAAPGVIGGRLAGVIRIPVKVQPEDGFHLTLECVRKTARGDSTINETLWQDEQIIARELRQADFEQTAVPVLFQIPYDCRPTDESSMKDQTFWRLKAAAKTPGLDYKAAFDVPVFQTPESDPNFASDPAAIAEYAAPVDPERELREAGVLKTALPFGYEPLKGTVPFLPTQKSGQSPGCRFVFPLGRNFGSSVFLLVFWLFWSGAILVMLHFRAPIFFPIGFGLFDVIILLIGLDLWFYRSVVDVSPRGLTVTGGLFGRGRSRQIEASSIDRIEAVGGMTSGNMVYYNIVVVSRGKKISLGKRVQGKWLAEAVCRQIKEALAM
jgi:hypothetical protein